MKYIYGLHDTDLTEIRIEDSCIVLNFPAGVYELDTNGKELSLTSMCKMVLHLRYSQNILDNICITKRKKDRTRDITFYELENMLSKCCFEIENNYYSEFDNSMLLKGYIGLYNVELIITDIIKYDFLF